MSVNTIVNSTMEQSALGQNSAPLEYVVRSNGELLTVAGKPQQTVLNIKEKLGEMINISSCQIFLFFNGNILHNQSLMADCDLGTQGIIDMFCRLPGEAQHIIIATMSDESDIPAIVTPQELINRLQRDNMIEEKLEECSKHPLKAWSLNCVTLETEALNFATNQAAFQHKEVGIAEKSKYDDKTVQDELKELRHAAVVATATIERMEWIIEDLKAQMAIKATALRGQIKTNEETVNDLRAQIVTKDTTERKLKFEIVQKGLFEDVVSNFVGAVLLELERSFVLKKQVTNVCCCLGRAYFDGIGVSQDYKTALRLFTLAVGNNHSDAQYYAGRCYFYGRGVTVNRHHAVVLWRQAADQGHGLAFHSLADAHASRNWWSQGMIGNILEAISLYKMAADLGVTDATTALEELGKHCLENGLNYDKYDVDRTVSFACFTVAAAAGNGKGQVMLGRCYFFGYGVEKDAAKAMKLYKLSADNGHHGAQYIVAEMYAKGEVDGIIRDQQQAIVYYKLAAAKGHSNAQYELGGLYATGDGNVRDVEQAVLFYKLCVDQGGWRSSDAREKLLELSKFETPPKPQRIVLTTLQPLQEIFSQKWICHSVKVADNMVEATEVKHEMAGVKAAVTSKTEGEQDEAVVKEDENEQEEEVKEIYCLVDEVAQNKMLAANIVAVREENDEKKESSPRVKEEALDTVDIVAENDEEEENSRLVALNNVMAANFVVVENEMKERVIEEDDEEKAVMKKDENERQEENEEEVEFDSTNCSVC